MKISKTLVTVDALRKTADRLEKGATYNWCHMGHCNCGHLAQTLTSLTPAQIHKAAIERAGDWTDQSIEYCTSTGYTMDHVFDTINKAGFTQDDIRHLERLSDQRVLKFIPPERRKELNYKDVNDVVLYMRTWATLIESTLLNKVNIDILLSFDPEVIIQ